VCLAASIGFIPHTPPSDPCRWSDDWMLQHAARPTLSVEEFGLVRTGRWRDRNGVRVDFGLGNPPCSCDVSFSAVIGVHLCQIEHPAPDALAI
jgi:hypothetical protein